MGRYCELASCWSNDNTLKNLQQYPWMRGRDLGEIPNKLYNVCDMEEIASDRGGKTNLKPRLIRDCVHFFCQGTATKGWTCCGLPQIFLLEQLWTCTESEKVGSSGEASTSRGSSRQPTRCKPRRRAGGCR